MSTTTPSEFLGSAGKWWAYLLIGQSWIWLLAGGILVCLLGVCVLLDPTEKLTRYFWTALGALVAGVYHLMLAFQLKGIARLAKKQR